jgi:hypothetical protein
MSDGWEKKRNGAYIRRRDQELADLDKGNIFSLVPPEIHYTIIGIPLDDMATPIPSNVLLNVVRGKSGDLILCDGRKQMLRLLPDSARCLREQFGDRGLHSVIGKVTEGPNDYGFYQIKVAPLRKESQ